MSVVGKILQVTPGTYVNQFPIEFTTSTTNQFTHDSIYLGESASSVNNYYVNYFCHIAGTNNFDPKVISYDGATKIASISSWTGTNFQSTGTTSSISISSVAVSSFTSYTNVWLVNYTKSASAPTPVASDRIQSASRSYIVTTATTSQLRLAGDPFNTTLAPSTGIAVVTPTRWSAGTPRVGSNVQLIKDYPVVSTFTWEKDGVEIPYIKGASYTPSSAGVYTVVEKAARYNDIVSEGTASIQTFSYSVSGLKDDTLTYWDNLEYLGAFRAPNYDQGGNDNTSNGGPIAFYAAGNSGAGSIIARGNSALNKVYEMSIPNQDTWAVSENDTMPVATILSNGTVDPIEGQLNLSGITGIANNSIGGLLVYDDSLIVTAHNPYSTSTVAAWFWKRPVNLSTTGQVQGPFAVSDILTSNTFPYNNYRCFAGYLSALSSSTQTLLGNPVVCGLSAANTDSNTSDGPAIASLNPGNLSGVTGYRNTFTINSEVSITLNAGASTVTNYFAGWRLTTLSGENGLGTISSYNGETKIATVSGGGFSGTAGTFQGLLIPPVSAKALAMYSSGQLQSGIEYQIQGIFNSTGRDIKGIVAPNGTDSVLLFGRMGNGWYQKNAVSTISKSGKRYFNSTSTVDIVGDKAWPYHSKIWCYNSRDLEQVKLGNQTPGMVKPYATYNFEFPFADGPITGITYDSILRRIYIAVTSSYTQNTVLHVYRVNNAVSSFLAGQDYPIKSLALPGDFSWPTSLEQPLNTLITSSPIRITGIAPNSRIRPNRLSAAISINNKPFTSQEQTVNNDDIVRCQATTSAQTDTVGSVGVIINGVTIGGWSYRTHNESREPQVFQVGPARAIQTLNQIASTLVAGDIVELDPGTYPSVTLTRSGSVGKPIVIRGNNSVFSGGTFTIHLSGSHNVILDNLEITGGTEVGLRSQAQNIILQNSKVYNCPRHGILGADRGSGNFTIKNCEIYGVGGLLPGEAFKHAVYVATDKDAFPNSVLRLENNYIHSYKGNGVKSRAARTELYYNWIDGQNDPQTLYNIELIGYQEFFYHTDLLNSDVVGNVFISNSLYTMRLGGDGSGSSRGRVRLAHNTILIGSSFNQFNPIIRMASKLDSVYLINNLFARSDNSTLALRLFRDDITSTGVWTSGRFKIAGTTNLMPANTNISPATELINNVQTQTTPADLSDQLPGYNIENPLIQMAYVANTSTSNIPRTITKIGALE